MEQDLVLLRREGPVSILTLNRPERLNAWTYPLGDVYFDLLDEADADPQVRAVVVTGAGRGFCAGLDAESLASSASGVKRKPAKGRRMSHAANFRKPLIGAINGGCAGFGFVQALHFDVRFAAASAIFTTAFVRRGLNAEYGSSWLLPRIVGHARAMDLLLSGRRFDANEAFQIGLVARVLPDAELLDHAISYARELATHCSPIAMADAKVQVHADWFATRVESEDRAKALGHLPGHRADFPEGAASLRERRAPSFHPLPARDAAAGTVIARGSEYDEH
ncbi:enoyl-CoA hydratase-related protein [Caballeronia sp. LZ001]|uniref:enoyl-CoA hydratase-related protein n=1 Tax=Caballeronia sp. LZ001 TaxID=3038553 RepID=UPI002863DB4E|nr:enoyl-CoA hydratase-related protein [Caballeronia sp. LZ001]MDR5804857.1 enoyl-CoA hydratase-related protein [Caballeronia sp. LZ001]